MRNSAKRDPIEQEIYENKLKEYVKKVQDGELTSYRAAKLSGEGDFLII
jgi:hypothetical protein